MSTAPAATGRTTPSVTASAPPTAPDTVLSIAQLEGTVLEIGPGSGANLRHYGPWVRWMGVEPDRSRHPAIRREAARLGMSVELIAGVAEAVDRPDSSVDAVVGTLVLCSVGDVDRSLAEVRRVLRPRGRYVFDEHVAAPRGTWLRRGQAVHARLVPGECRPDRETGAALERAGFDDLTYDGYRVPGPFGVPLPYIAGSAIA